MYPVNFAGSSPFAGQQYQQSIMANQSAMMMQMMMSMMASLMMAQMAQNGSGGGCPCQGGGAFSPGMVPGFGGGPGGNGAGSGPFPGGMPGYGPFGGSGGGGGGAAEPGAPSPSTPSRSGGGSAAENGPRSGRIVDVPGGRVDSSIAGNVRQMMDAARRDGVNLQINSSYRSRAQQERLYAAYRNGTGNLAARPGTSNHESGLAIDFRRTPGAFEWLRNNAERFGLRNLPGEPWHYSTTGR